MYNFSLARNQYINNSLIYFPCIRAGANTGKKACICAEMNSLILANMRKILFLNNIFPYSRECEYRPRMHSRKN